MTIAEPILSNASGQSDQPKLYRFPRAVYEKLVDLGLFQDQQVELIDGEILQMSPINDPHAWACATVTSKLYRVFGLDAYIRAQSPMAIGDSLPQPDVAVIATSPQKPGKHPSSALLVVEISDTTLRFDRTDKASLYASANISEYWILNLKDRQLEVHRNPQPDASQRFGYGYADIKILKPEDTIVPQTAPSALPIKIADMLP